MAYIAQRYRLRLNLQLFAGEKTEDATPKRKQDARNKGQVAKSQELPAALILLAAFLILYFFSDYFFGQIYALFRGALEQYLLMELTIPNFQMIIIKSIYHGFLILAPILITIVVIGIASNFLQFGFLFTSDPLLPKFSKINPLSGLQRMFSMKSLVELIKSLLKVGVVGYVTFSTVWDDRANLMMLAQLPVGGMLSYVASLAFWIGLKAGVLLLVIAIFDYIYQRYEFEKELKMSKEEVKQEFKNTEGDPMVKAKIREIQRRMAMKRMMQEVPKADVIITNPTHYAVALRYDGTTMQSPILLAKGVDFIALRIREVAAENGIVMMENKALARAIYHQVEIGESIPPELFQAVAEVLAYVYGLRKKVN